MYDENSLMTTKKVLWIWNANIWIRLLWPRNKNDEMVFFLYGWKNAYLHTDYI